MNIIDYTAWHKEHAPKKYQTVYLVDTVKGGPHRFVDPTVEQNDREIVFKVDLPDDQFTVTTFNKGGVLTITMRRELIK